MENKRADRQWFIRKIILFVFACIVFVGFVITDLVIKPEIVSKKKYEMPEKAVAMKILDLSAWNEVTDWGKIKASGVDGVILRIARYNLGFDPKFDEYYNVAKEQGLYVGCYFFMNATTEKEAEEDALYVIDIIKKGQYEFELPVFYDVEDDGTNGNTVSHLSRKELTNIIKAFCEKMLVNNFYAGYYCNLNFVAGEIYPEKLYKYPFWLAAWNRDIEGDEYPNLTVWQATDNFSIQGVTEPCDLNYCFVDFEGFILKKGYNVY